MKYGRKNFENMTHRRYEYLKGLNGHSEMALSVDTFEEVDAAYNNAIYKMVQHLYYNQNLNLGDRELAIFLIQKVI